MSKIIHQIAISDLLPKDYNAPNYDSIVQNFKGYQHIMWDYKKIKNFILKNKDDYVLNAIDSISANAFKADVARYYIVYKLGGWYSDVNNFFIKEPPDQNNEMIFFRDIQQLTASSWSVQCSLFYATKGHHILKKTFDACVQNINNKYYGGHALCPTGPNLFGSVIASDNLPEGSSYLIGDMRKEKDISGFYLDENLFAKYKPNNLEPANSGIFGGNNYEKIWYSRELYG